MNFSQDKALVVFSGGQDSTTCLHWAINKWGRENVRTITFVYGQKHRVELQSAREICDKAKIIFDLIYIPDVLRSSSPLVDISEKLDQFSNLTQVKPGLQNTFVPGRNILFLSIAGNLASHFGIANIVTGVCQEDFGGYYDCRQSFIDSMQATLGEGIAGDKSIFKIHTPLMDLSKKETVMLAKSLGDECLEALALSHTCYAGLRPPCGKCHACLIRARGFEEAGFDDPLVKNYNAL